MHTVNVIAHLATVAGYLLVPLTWLRHLALSRPVLLAGVLFFASGAAIHLGLVFGAEGRHWMVVARVVQAVAVVWSVLGFWRLLLHAEEIRRMAEARRGMTMVTTKTVDVVDGKAR